MCGLFVGPFEKSEKRAWYPLFAHVLNFPTFQEFLIIPLLHVYCHKFICILLTGVYDLGSAVLYASL